MRVLQDENDRERSDNRERKVTDDNDGFGVPDDLRRFAIIIGLRNDDGARLLGRQHVIVFRFTRLLVGSP